MSFLFALLQLVNFAILDDTVVAQHKSADHIQLSEPTADLNRPIVNPCAGTSCR